MLTFSRLRIAWGAVLTTALLAACVAVDAVAQGDGERHCTAVGCKSMLRLHFGDYVSQHPSITRVRLCAQGRCRSARRETLEAGQVMLAVNATSDAPIRITVLAYDRRGSLRLKRSLRLTIEGRYANGPECGGPICYYGTARLTRHGRLKDIGPGLT